MGQVSCENHARVGSTLMACGGDQLSRCTLRQTNGQTVQSSSNRNVSVGWLPLSPLRWPSSHAPYDVTVVRAPVRSRSSLDRRAASPHTYSQSRKKAKNVKCTAAMLPTAVMRPNQIPVSPENHHGGSTTLRVGGPTFQSHVQMESHQVR